MLQAPYRFIRLVVTSKGDNWVTDAPGVVILGTEVQAMAERKHKRIGSWVVRDLYQRGGIWYGRIRNTETGRFKYLSTREANRRRAEQKVIDWVEDLQRRGVEPMESNAVRFDSAFEEFLSLKHVRPSTLADYTRTGKKVFIPAFGEKLVSEVELRDVEEFLKHLERERGIVARTQQKYLTELRSFFHWAQRREYCVKDPTDGLKIGRISKRQGIALIHEQARKLLVACSTPIVRKVEYSNREAAVQEYQPPEHLKLATLIALHTGLRRGNVVRLRWSQVDLEKRKITIPGEEMKAHNDFEVPVHPELAEVLGEGLGSQKRVNPDAAVLGREFGEIKKSFKSALKRAALPDIRWHDLRHTFATWLSTRTTYAVLRQLLGHSPGSVTLQYSHVPFSELQTVIDAMPRLLETEKMKRL